QERPPAGGRGRPREPAVDRLEYRTTGTRWSRSVLRHSLVYSIPTKRRQHVRIGFGIPGAEPADHRHRPLLRLAASCHAAAPPNAAMNSRRRRLICPSCAREPYPGRIAQPEPVGAADRLLHCGCCTAESRPPPPTGFWQRWVINRKAQSEHISSAFFEESGR